jgi:hypothetical protein
MKSLGKILALGTALALQGCGKSYAPVNPLGASVAPAPAVFCPARFSFENGSLAHWQGLAWATGFQNMGISGQYASCGNLAMRLHLALGGTSTAVIQYTFDGIQSVSAAPFSMQIYAPAGTPSTVKVQAVFLKTDGSWGASTSAIAITPGAWAPITASMSLATATAFQMDFSNSSGFWNGDLWVDDINW